MTSADRESNRYLLIALLVFIAVSAFGGGVYALDGAEGVPVEWLHGSAFSSYVVPGLVLVLVVGGSAIGAAIALFVGHESGFTLAKIAGWMLAIWLVEQVVIVGFVSWLQPATALVGFAILTLAYRTPRLHDHQVSVP